MTILALEFSSRRRSVALGHAGKVLAEAVEQTTERGTNAFALIERVLTEANVSREEIKAIAVGLGPGSYTGIRAAIAIAQGWQLACGVNLLGVSSAAALAAQAQAEQIFGRVNVVIDAQRGEFYLALWEISAVSCREQGELKIVPASHVEALRLAGEIVLGPEMNNFFPSAPSVAQLAMSGQLRETSDGRLVPIYLREVNFVKSPPTKNLF